MTHPERALPLRDHKGYRSPVVRIQQTRTLTADRLAELDALAALIAEENGDTAEITAERRADLLAEIEDRWGEGAGRPDAWDRAIRAGLHELGSAA